MGMSERRTGSIANAHGDIVFSSGAAIASGRIALTIAQALVALPYGWRWLATHDMPDGTWIVVQRGGERWEPRR